MRGYREIVRPAKYSNETVIVKTRIYPIKSNVLFRPTRHWLIVCSISVQELVEKDEVLHLAMRLQFGWMDKRLRWNPANFSGLLSIILPGHTVWYGNKAWKIYCLLIAFFTQDS